MLTGEASFDKIDKFAQNTAARPASKACEFEIRTEPSDPRTLPSSNSAIKFEDTNTVALPSVGP